MFFMSTAPRPQSMPSLMTPSNGSTRQLSGSAGTTSSVAVHDERGLARVGTLDAGDDARAAGFRVEELRLQAQLLEVRCQVFGGIRLAVGLALAVVRGVEADEIARDLRSGVEFRIVCAGGHCSTVPVGALGCRAHAILVRGCPHPDDHCARMAEMADALA